MLAPLLFAIAVTASAAPADRQAAGERALEKGDYAAARQIFSEQATSDPKDYSALFNLAFAESALNQDPPAIEHLKQVLVLKPNLFEAELNLGILYLRNKQEASAEPLLREAVRQKPAQARAQRYYGEALLATGNAAAAQEAFESAIKEDSKNSAAELGLAKSLLRQTKLDEAAPHYKAASALDPKLGSYELELAQAYEQAHRSDQAIPLLEQFGDTPGAHEELGRLFLDAGKPDQAVRQFQLAVTAAPTTANKLALATAYLKENQGDSAEPLLQEAMRSNPQDYDVIDAVAKVEMGKRDFRQAATLFLQATRLHPKAAESWGNAATCLMLGGQYPAALSALDQVRALGAEKPGDIYFRALTLDKLHQVKPALASYQQFLQLSQGKFPDQEFLARHRSIALEKELNR